MAAAASAASRPTCRRWATVVALSAGLHALVLGGLAFRVAESPRVLSLTTLDVSLAPALPFAIPASAPVAPKPLPKEGRIVPMEPTAPRFAVTDRAGTGDAGDAVDLFGPVFDDGMWPRPMVVARAPCDPEEDFERAAACRRKLLLIGLASEPRDGANRGP